MSRLQELDREKAGVAAMLELSSIFESTASMRIARTKDQVLQATIFFNELWQLYTQLRVDSIFRFGRQASGDQVVDKELYIIITGEGGFSGDIDQKLIVYMLETYDPARHDIIVIGHHGALQLAQRGISFKKYYKLPAKDQNINTAPIIQHVQAYRGASVFYQEYVSLMVQDVKKIALSKVVAEIGDKVKEGEEAISEANYIFEPSTFAVVSHLEQSMMKIALEQLILDSKLAQYASRFRAMSAAHQLAEEQFDDVQLRYNRARRAVRDERLKEIVNGLRKAAAR